MRIATTCDMTAGWHTPTGEIATALSLEISAPTKTIEEHDALRKVIEDAIKEFGFTVQQIPSM